MGTWNINNGIISLCEDNKFYYPTADELFKQRGNSVFIIDGNRYPNPESALNIRISRIGLQVTLTFISSENNKLAAKLYVTKKGNKSEIHLHQGVFADYIILDDTLHYLCGDYSSIAEIIRNNKFSVSELRFAEYLKFKRILIEENIDFIDEIETTITSIKEDETSIQAVGLKANLFPYQDSGCNWLSFMVKNKCGCILGDEMGLGKTLQIIALFGKYKETLNNNPKFLVICPVSLLENWKRELNRFYPSLSVLVHHGSYRTGNYKDLIGFDVVVMSYSNVQTDLSMLSMINWNIVAIDEAQNIKNPSAKRTRNIKLLNREVSVAVTGTPFENHMTDVWSIVDFVLPGFLGNLSQFEKTFSDSTDSARRLEKFISPIMIRRRVSQVAKDLPERIDIPTPIRMTEEEAKFYDSERKNESEKLDALNDFNIFTIQKLRQYCTHPLVYNPEIEEKDPVSISTKYQRLCEILEEIFDANEKAIVFTSFTEMSNIIVRDIAKRFTVFVKAINGSVEVNRRQAIIDEFSAVNGKALLVLNPKAAGAGLNITAANHVIHYNLEWNPAVEDQASARAYRRGQVKTVFVHRLYYTGTVEEIINEKIQKKRDISNTAIIGNSGSISKDELIRILGISPYNNLR